MLNYGEAFKYQRKNAGLSQTQLAKALNIPQQTISWNETNQGTPNIDFCVQLADFYGISLDELIGRDYGRETKRNTYNNYGTHNGTVKF